MLYWINWPRKTGEIFVFHAGLNGFCILACSLLRFVPRRGHLGVPCKRVFPGGRYCPRLCPRYLLPSWDAQTHNASTVGQGSYPIHAYYMTLYDADPDTHKHKLCGPFVRVAASTRTFLFLACLHAIFRNIIFTAKKLTHPSIFIKFV